MKNIKRIDEAVGSILERRVAADRLLKDVVKGSTSSVEGIKLSKEMAQAFLDWQKMSTYGKKFGKLPFNMLFTAAFNWGLDRYIGKDKKIKAEYKELKAKAKEMSKLQKESEELNESTAKKVLKDAIDALTKTFAGKKLDKAYVKDYLESMEKMARKSPREFVKDYMNFSNDDWIEDVEYNMANESITEKVKPGKYSGLYYDTAEKVLKRERIKFPSALIDNMLKRAHEEGHLEYTAKFVRDAEKDIRSAIDKIGKDDLKMFAYGANEGFRRSQEPFTFTAKEVQDAADLIAKALTRMDKVKAEVHDMDYAEGEGAGFEISLDGEKYEGGSYDVRPTGEIVNVAIGNSFPNAIYAKIGDKNINQIMKNIKKFESAEVNEMYRALQLSNMLLDMIRDGKRKGVETPTADEIQKLAPRLGKKRIQKRDVQDVIDGWEQSLKDAKGETMRNKMFGVTAKVFEAAPRMKTSKETEELEKIKKLVVNARKGGMGNRYGKEFDRAKNKAVVALDNMISYSKIGS